MIKANRQVKKWHQKMDCLNIHVSESLVNWIAQDEGFSPSILGKKGQYGILQSMATRAKFLSNPEHRIIFHYTPKHCSWFSSAVLRVSALRGFPPLSRNVIRASHIATDEGGGFPHERLLNPSG